jgi:hypothetical protein
MISANDAPKRPSRGSLRLALLILGVLPCFGIAHIAASINLVFDRAFDYGPKPSPPRYPNSSNIKQWADLSDVSFPKGMIAFETTDQPDQVQQYYKRYLNGAGWKFGDFPFTDPNVSYFQHWPDEGPVYKVMIRAEAEEAGPTQVVITMTSNYHNWYGEFWRVDP